MSRIDLNKRVCLLCDYGIVFNEIQELNALQDPHPTIEVLCNNPQFEIWTKNWWPTKVPSKNSEEFHSPIKHKRQLHLRYLGSGCAFGGGKVHPLATLNTPPFSLSVGLICIWRHFSTQVYHTTTLYMRCPSSMWQCGGFFAQSFFSHGLRIYQKQTHLQPFGQELEIPKNAPPPKQSIANTIPKDFSLSQAESWISTMKVWHSTGAPFCS